MMHPDKQKLVRDSFGRSKMLQLFEAEITDMEEGYFEITLPQIDFMCRPGGVFNGSTISAAIDVAAGYAAVTAQKNDAIFTTVSLLVNFLRPARGNYLKTRARVIKKGKAITVVQVDVVATTEANAIIEGTPAATATVTLMLLKTKEINTK